MQVKKFVILNRRSDERFGFKCYLDLVSKTDPATIGLVLSNYVSSENQYDDSILILDDKFTGFYKTIVFL